MKTVDEMLNKDFASSLMKAGVGDLLATFQKHVSFERAQAAAKSIAHHLTAEGFTPPEQIAAMLLGGIAGISALQMINDYPEDAIAAAQAEESNEPVGSEHQEG